MPKRSENEPLDKGVERPDIVWVGKEIAPGDLYGRFLEFANRRLCERDQSKPPC